MDTNVIIAIVAVVVIAAILVIGGWWLGKTRKNAINKSTEDAKAAADARLAAEAKSAAADSSTVKPSVDSNVDAAEKALAESHRFAADHIHHQQPLCQFQYVFNRVCQTALNTILYHQTIYHDVDIVLDIFIQRDLLGKLV